ncbi:hypothetical protein [Nocardia arizonensis]|nr:hypothetical protein [Nocardia arizonensis]
MLFVGLGIASTNLKPSPEVPHADSHSEIYLFHSDERVSLMK